MTTARRIVTFVSLFRGLYGVAAVAAPDPLLKLQGAPAAEASPTARVLQQFFGVRDVVVALFTLDARKDDEQLRRAIAFNGVSEIGDLTVALLMLRDGTAPRATVALSFALPVGALASWAIALRELR
jgi:hypothetical protein